MEAGSLGTGGVANRKTRVFKCKVEGSKWSHTLKLAGGLEIEEVWERVKKKKGFGPQSRLFFSSARRKTRAYVQARSALRGEMFRAAAAWADVSPAKKRSLTNSPA